MDNSTSKRLHSFFVENREKATVSGVDKVLSFGEDEICLIVSSGKLTVLGKNFKIEKFDEKEGFLSFTGIVDCFKYLGTKQPLLKRIFK